MPAPNAGFARKRRLAACENRRISQRSMLNAFTMRLPVTVSCNRFWISASLSWPRRVVLRTLPANLLRREDDHRHEEQQHQREPAAINNHDRSGK